ncbi:MAG: rRNA pseudouridine synthase [Oligoflexia bacterium]|nr:rRNA pseudouridine synthase [Oligoflexia bacterium]
MKTKHFRLNHFLSSCGVCSRRKADEIIKSGKVTVNNKRSLDPAMKIHPEEDQVKLDGKGIHPPQQKYYIAFNKPKKVITSMNDPKNRPCIADYFIPVGFESSRFKGLATKRKKPKSYGKIIPNGYKKAKDRIFPIGRLDWHSEGLILLTNDGDFSRKVLQKKIPKTYLLKLDGRPTTAQLLKLKKGVYTEVGRLKAVYIKELKQQASQHSWVKVMLTEGRNRQLHRMFEKIGFQIKVLRRIGIGRLKLRSLKPGEYFLLSPMDIKKVFSLPSELQSKKSRKISKRER